MEKQAGIKNFEPFGVINTINTLANGDILKWAQIKQLPYEVYLTKLILSKVEREYQTKYSNLMKTQSESGRKK